LPWVWSPPRRQDAERLQRHIRPTHRLPSGLCCRQAGLGELVGLYGSVRRQRLAATASLALLLLRPAMEAVEALAERLLLLGDPLGAVHAASVTLEPLTRIRVRCICRVSG